MKFRVISIKTAAGAHSPFRVVEQDSGREVGWINRYLDREYVRRLANKSLYSFFMPKIEKTASAARRIRSGLKTD